VTKFPRPTKSSPIPVFPGVVAGAILAAITILAAPSPADASVARPAPLPDEAGCDHYRGKTLGANDPTQRFELLVCAGPRGVTAKVQTSSLVSGWSVRASEGSWDPSGQTLTLHDTHFVESHPEPDWYFCLIDDMVLTKSPKGLRGAYEASACEDSAELELALLSPGQWKLQPESEAAPGVPPRDSGTTQDAPEPPVNAKRIENVKRVGHPEPATSLPKDGCTCSTRETAPSPAPACLLLSGLAALHRRRRPPSPMTPDPGDQSSPKARALPQPGPGPNP